MALSYAREIARDIVELLVSKSLTVEVWDGDASEFVDTAPTISFDWHPRYKLTDLVIPTVSVVPSSETSEVLSREKLQHEVEVQLGVMLKLSRSDDEQVSEIDRMAVLVSEIRNALQMQDFEYEDGAVASFSSVSVETLIVSEGVEELRQFSALINATYLVN